MRAGLVEIPSQEDGLSPPDLLSYRWSSLSDYAGRPSARPRWLDARDGFSACELKDSPKGRRLFVERLAERAAADRAERAGLSVVEGQGLQSTLRRGWCYGTDAFKGMMLEAAEKLIARRRASGGAHYSGGEVRGYDERAAEEIVREALRGLGISNNELRKMKKGAAEKGLIARKVRRETSAGAEWIAKRLAMGAPSAIPRIVAAAEEGLREDRNLRRLEKKIND